MQFISKYWLSLILLAASAVVAQQCGPMAAPANAATDAAATAPKPSGLESVLSTMDDASEKFRSAQADLNSQQYQKVVDETDVQKGKVYFRRKNKELEMKLDIAQPESKYVLVKEGKAQLYQPGIDQVTEYSIASKEEAEGMFALGFGGRGHDLLKSFSVKYGGDEAVDGTKTAKLELTPKSARVHNMFTLITLWIDASRGVSLKQQFDEPSGDYRRAFYTNIKLNPRLSDDLFKLNTTTKTKVVHPQG